MAEFEAHLADNAAAFGRDGTIDKGHIREKKQIAGRVREALEKVLKYCVEDCADWLLAQAKQLLKEFDDAMKDFAQAIDQQDWVLALACLALMIAIAWALIALAAAAAAAALAPAI